MNNEALKQKTNELASFCAIPTNIGFISMQNTRLRKRKHAPFAG